MALQDWQLQFLEREAALGKDYGKLQADMGWGFPVEPPPGPTGDDIVAALAAALGGGSFNTDFNQGGVIRTPAGSFNTDFNQGPVLGGQGGGQGQSLPEDPNLRLSGRGRPDYPDHLQDQRSDPSTSAPYDPTKVPGFALPPKSREPISFLTGFNLPDTVVLKPNNTGGGPTGPVDPSADPNLWTSPMPGYIQFHPGGAVYEWTDDAATMQANQHLLTPVSGMDWHREFGIDQYIPDPTSFVAGASLPKDERAIVPTDFARRDQWIREHRKGEHPLHPGYTPAEMNQINMIIQERAMNEMARRQQEIANYLGGGGGGTFGGGTFGGGSWQGQAYSPYAPYNFPQQSYGYSASGIPPAAVGAYATPPVVPAGEPSFLPDPDPLDAHLELNSIGLARLPVDARLELDKWLKNMGYTTASLGQFGPQAYTRPTGWEDEIAFTADDYGRITDPIVRGWIKWLLGEMGYSTASQYPGAVAP